MSTSADEREAVTVPVQKYIDGISQTDTRLIAEAFHPSATISVHFGDEFFINNAVDTIVRHMTKAPPVAETSPEFSAEIESVEQIGTMAAVKIVEKNLEGMNFTTLFHLHKVNGHWIISSKATYAAPEGATQQSA